MTYSIQELYELSSEDKRNSNTLINVLHDFVNVKGSITIEELADEFEINQITAERWVKGKTLPHPAVREHVVNWVINRG